jgi:nucleoside phosphorylase
VRQMRCDKTTGQRPQETLMSIDFGVVTALPLERDAVLPFLEDHHQVRRSSNDIRTYDVGVIAGYSVAISLSLRAGNVDSAVVTTDLIRFWQPSYLAMLGIAAGVPRDGLQLGDVVMADQIIEVDYAKESSSGVDVRWRAHDTDAMMLDRARSMDARRNTDRQDYPRLFIGPVATGSRVIASTQARDSLLRLHSRILAIEMESGGIAVAAWQRETPTRIVVIRGISDMGDKFKSDEHQPSAAAAAARVFVDLLQTRPFESNAVPPRSFELGRDKDNLERFYRNPLSHRREG